MAQGVFTTHYTQLNAEQKRAVDAIEGPVMVVAGPGTGKTQILTLRIANILRKTDAPPEAILALTFTESAAASCRRRLVDIVGTPGYRVQVHTFHSYANEIIQRFPDSFPRIVGSRPLSSVERIALLQHLVDTTPLKILRPFGNIYFYIPAIAQKISELKREHITPEAFRMALKKSVKTFNTIPDLYHKKGQYKGMMQGKYVQTSKRYDRDAELLKLYIAYEAALMEKHVYDYEDMLLEVIRALRRDTDLLLTLQEEAQYVLADEQQDVNESQNQLLELLVNFHENPNIFVVGDERQAIYRFQGASLDNFLFFKKQFPSAVCIDLKHNYRSTQPILNAAHTLISHTKNATYIPLIAQDKTVSQNITLQVVGRPSDECVFVAKAIRHSIDEGVDPRDIAVIYRVNHDAEGIYAALLAEGVPAVIESEQNALSSISIQKLLAILTAVVHYGRDEKLVPLLHIDFIGIDPLAAVRFLSYQKIRLLSALVQKATLRKMGIKDSEPFISLGKKLERWKRLSHNEGLLTVLDAIAEESGFIPAILSAAYPEEKIAQMKALFGEAATLLKSNRHASLQTFLEHLTLLEEYNLSLSVPASFGDRPAVHLLTAHRSKGQEFSQVYIMHAYDGHWGNRREHLFFSAFKPDTTKDIDDERRLFYVALTRARKQVTITYPRENENGKQVLPAEFIEEIGEHILAQEEEKNALTPFSTKKLPTPYLDKKFILELFAKRGLSATALNNYLECPWRYFYRNLLRIPEAPQKELEYGTAIHAALREFFEQWKEGKNPGTKGLLVFFKRALKHSSLPETIFIDTCRKGVNALTTYYVQGHAAWSRGILNEYSITTRIQTHNTNVPRLRLRGDIDKLSVDKDGVTRIHDYKTGKPKPKGFILGKDGARAWGPYKRQLLFYKLLLEHYTLMRQNTSLREVGEGIIEFIEPNERGKSLSVAVPLTDTDVALLKELLLEVTEDIASFSFTEKGCNKKDCRYCVLRTYLPELLG